MKADGTYTGGINAVLILGDNRLATSIVSGVSSSGIHVHQAVHTTFSTESHGVTIHRTDFSSHSLRDTFDNAKPDLIFSTVSGGSFERQKEIIDLAIAAKVPRFVPAEFAQDSLNETIQARLPPCKERARVIQYLRSQAGQGHLSWSAVATGCQLEQALVSGNIGFDLKWQSVTVHGTGDEWFPASSSAWNGRVALAMTQKWDDIRDQYLYASGTTTCVNEILESLQRQTGQKWGRGAVEVEEIVREAERRMERGFPDAGMFLMERSVLFDEKLQALNPFVVNDAKDKLGLEGEDVESLVKNVVHDFKHHGKGDCGCE